MTWYLVTLRPSPRVLESGWSAADEASVEAHFKRLVALRKDGVVLLAGRTDEPDDKTVGLVLYRADSADEARRLSDEDPAVAAGAMVAEFRPFRLAVGEPGA